MGANVGLGLLGLAQVKSNVNSSGYITYNYNGLFWGIQAARIVLNIWSICDAVHVAKVKNMYYQDLRGQRTSLDFNVEPFVIYAQTETFGSVKPVAGLSLRVSF